MAFEAVLFDLDGTILDSIDGIIASFEHAFSQHLPSFKPSRRDLIVKIGEPLDVQMLAFAKGDRELAVRMVAAYRTHNLNILPALELYDGAKETIAALRARGFVTGLVTSKSIVSANVTLDGHDLRPLFDIVMTSEDTTRHKPDPMPLLVACARLGLHPRDVVYVGDSIHDVKCAHGAGAAAAAALWGPFEEEMLAALGPRYMLRQFRDLLELPDLSRVLTQK